MELRCTQTIAVSSIPIIRSNNLLLERPFLCGQAIRSSPKSRIRSYCPDSTGPLNKLVHFKVQASGATTLGSLAAESPKDENIIFVAGATGKVGSRTVRELLKLGFKVRAGVRSAQRAEPLMKSVQQMKLAEAATPAIDMLEVVECDLEKTEQIGPALRSASVVICCIGASEKEIFDVTGPFRIDYQATKNLIDAATVAKVKHFILLTSLGTNKVGFPAAILNLFWGVLIWKRKAEEALLASGIPYTIVRPGGMERPTDSYKETHNITLSQEDTLFGGQVSNLQVAELMAFMAKNLDLSYCKVVEVIAETTAPSTPMGELLTKIPPQRGGTPPKEPAVVDKPEPVSKSISSESLPISTEKESTPSKPVLRTPSSPYIAYEDLKPPVSPTPKAPSGSKEVTMIETAPKPTSVDSESSTESATISGTPETETEPEPEPEAAAARVQRSSSLSPYIAYEDLKPPTSPTPTAPTGPSKIPLVSPVTEGDASQQLTGNNVPLVEAEVVAEKEPPQALTSSQSPYPGYGDLKPPTSPSPNSPSVSIPSTTTTDNGGNGSTRTTTKSRPLSPFYMYNDLKPPTSPIPSSPKK